MPAVLLDARERLPSRRFLRLAIAAWIRPVLDWIDPG